MFLAIFGMFYHENADLSYHFLPFETSKAELMTHWTC